MALSIRINENQVGECLAKLLSSAEKSGLSVLGVVDEVPDEVALAISSVRTSDFTLFLTRHSAIPPGIERHCSRIYRPHHPLPGRIGGFFMADKSALFNLRGSWYYAEDDAAILGQLAMIGEQVLCLTQDQSESDR